MPFTTVAYHKAAQNAALAAIQPIADPHVTVKGDDLTVPELNRIVGAIFCGSVPVQAQLQSPSLRTIFLEDVSVINNAESFASMPNKFQDYREDPLPLTSAEKLNVYMIMTADGRALIWLADGPIAPAHGAIRTIRAVPDVHGAEDVWTNSTLTLGQTLPAGRYQVVGLRVIGTNLLAGRLVFVGYSWRPGVPASTLLAGDDFPMFRRGKFGIFGEFEFDQPPSIDLLGSGVSANEQIWLDLIQVRAGR